jgi:hypothetical protein
MAAAGEVRTKRSMASMRDQEQKSSTKAPSSGALARLAAGLRSARLASMAARANATSASSNAARTHTAPSAAKSPSMCTAPL